MPASEFNRWKEYSAEEPFGQPWENWLMAVTAQMFAKVHRGKGGQAPTLDDFMYKGPAKIAEKEQQKIDRLMAFFDSNVK